MGGTDCEVAGLHSRVQDAFEARDTPVRAARRTARLPSLDTHASMSAVVIVATWTPRQRGTHYLRPTEPLGTGINLDDLTTLIARVTPTLVVIDGITEAMTLHSLNPLGQQGRGRVRATSSRVARGPRASRPVPGPRNQGQGRTRTLCARRGTQTQRPRRRRLHLLDNRAPFGIGLTGSIYSQDRQGQTGPATQARPSLEWREALVGDLILTSHADEFAEVIDRCRRPNATTTSAQPSPWPHRREVSRSTANCQARRSRRSSEARPQRYAARLHGCRSTDTSPTRHPTDYSRHIRLRAIHHDHPSPRPYLVPRRPRRPRLGLRPLVPLYRRGTRDAPPTGRKMNRLRSPLVPLERRGETPKPTVAAN